MFYLVIASVLDFCSCFCILSFIFITFDDDFVFWQALKKKKVKMQYMNLSGFISLGIINQVIKYYLFVNFFEERERERKC